MRQVGVLAAAGLVALRDGPAGMIERLADDHANARRLAEGLVAMPGISGLDVARVRTNFVLFRLAVPAGREAASTHAAFLAELARRGVLMVPYARGHLRAVTHHGIEAADIERALGHVSAALAAVGLGSDIRLMAR